MKVQITSLLRTSRTVFFIGILFFLPANNTQAIGIPPECESIPVILSTGGAASGLASATTGNNPISANENVLCAPVPRIKIPGLTFTSTSDFESLVERDSQGEITSYYIPFLGEYLSAFYRYSVALASVLCIFLIIISGIQWMFYGESPDNVDAAKTRIQGALTGLLLAVGSYTILYTIDPSLVEFKNLKIDVVQKIDYGALASRMLSLDPNGQAVFIPISDGTHRSTPGPNQPLLEEEVLELVKDTGLNPCIVVGTYKTEARSAYAIGQDENVRRCSVSSRRAFLASGQKYSGETFAPPQGTERTQYDGNECAVQIINNAQFDINNPPDYGLDWRFSKGIGLGQYTIFPSFTYSDEAHRRENSRIPGPNGPEWARHSSAANRWYTVTDLLNADLAFEATLGLMVRCDRRYREAGNNAIAFRNCYGGGSEPLSPTQWDLSDPPDPRFMRNYCQCITDHGSELGLPPDPLCQYY